MGKEPFSKLDEDRLACLPLGAAVQTALSHERSRDLQFSLDLVKRIASGTARTEAIARTVVDELAKHYEWDAVAIFRPDESAGRFSLVHQASQKEAFRLKEGWQHPLDRGVTGQVYRTGTSLNVPDVKAEKLNGLYLPVYTETHSELCIPILVDGRVYWIFNIEDIQRNAFAKEEQNRLESILGEVAVVLKLVSQSQVFDELLRCSQDGVIQTDMRGTITQVNDAAAELLDYSEKEMNGTALARYFKDKDQAQRVQQADRVPNEEVRFVRKDGEEVSILLSGTSLPREIGLKIFICNDLSMRKRRETVEILRQMFNEIASQIKTPLSLAFTWLDRLRRGEIPSPESDLLDKTVKQLHKVDLTFERLLVYERHERITPVNRSLFDIPTLIEKIKAEMPDLEAGTIEVTVAAGVPPVSGDIFQIWFCLESLLAYFVRFVLEDEKITVDISCRDKQVVTSIRGRAPSVTGGTLIDYAESRWAIRAITEMALGEEMMNSFIANHGGRIEQEREGDQTTYAIVLPCA
jgi:PAS domain S-box-containing protein